MNRLDSKEEKSAEESERDHENHTLVLTEPVPEDHTEPVHDASEGGQSILQAIIMVIGAIILVILLVLFARWIYHKVHNDQSKTAGVSQLPQPSSSNQSQPETGQPSGNQGSTATSNNSPSQPAANPGKPLANTGPGNVAAVFAGSTLAAAGLHYIISLRRFNKYGG